MFFLRRLHLQIYATIIASLVLVVALAALFFAPFEENRLDQRVYEISGKLTWLALPPATASREEQTRGLERLARELNITATLFDQNRDIIAAIGPPARRPRGNRGEDGWESTRARRHHGGGWVLKLPDSRWIVVRIGRFDRRRPFFALLLFIGVITLAVGIGSYPLVRRLTGRLDRLKDGVQRMGEGDLANRVLVEGRDEIASLAESFNTAAGRIEDLVTSNRTLLANASHELRTPLSRIRMGIELFENDPSEKRKAALQQDIAELDTLIDEILMMSRLDSGQIGSVDTQTDLLAIVAEEATRYEDVRIQGRANPFSANGKLLRRVVRNLLDNAAKYGEPPVLVQITDSSQKVTLTVTDHGPGIAPNEQESVFKRFYRTPGRQNVEGYGLGLPLVRQIAEVHGGQARILDEPGCAIEVTFKR